MGPRTAVYAAAVAALLVLVATLAAIVLAREQMRFDGWPAAPAPDTPKVECQTCR